MNNDWDGSDRRGSKVSLNDILLEVRECRNDIKHLTTSFNAHLVDDKENFGIVKKDLTILQRVAYGAFGAYILIQFFVSIGALNFSNSSIGSNNSDNINRNHNSNNVG